jgi:hypothetical protein
MKNGLKERKRKEGRFIDDMRPEVYNSGTGAFTIRHLSSLSCYWPEQVSAILRTEVTRSV